MNVVLILCAVVSLIISLMVTQYPNLAKLSSASQQGYNLSRSPAKNRETAVASGKEYREWAGYEIKRAAGLTGISLLILVFALAVASFVWLEGVAVAQDFILYLQNKIRYVFRVGVAERSMLSGMMHPFADRLIGISFVAALGSVLAFAAGTLWSFFASWVFPVRWLKWSRLPRYFQGEHNSWLLRKRQLQLLLSSNTPVSGPSTGVHD